MAHKKGAGSTDNGRDSAPQYLGVKKFGGEHVLAGNILVKQKGTKFHSGLNTYLGKDHTLHAKIEGIVGFKKVADSKRVVFVLPMNATATTVYDKAVKTEKVKVAAPVAPASKVQATPVAKVKTVIEAAPAAKAAETVVETPAAPTKTASAKSAKADDLKKIEGIGPKIEQLLHADGIVTFADLAAAPVEKVKEILHAAGPRYQMHNPETWGRQAALAAEGKWDELKKWQDEMDGGKE